MPPENRALPHERVEDTESKINPILSAEPERGKIESESSGISAVNDEQRRMKMRETVGNQVNSWKQKSHFEIRPPQQE